MAKQYLRKKPFWYAYVPLPWWVGFGIIMLTLLWIFSKTGLPVELETRV
jgi:hypothetical protein